MSPERYEQLMTALEDVEDVAAFDVAMAEGGPDIPWEQVKAAWAQSRTWCYTHFMPTTRPRHPVTETAQIAEILDDAARRWGDLPRTRLIQLILDDWAAGGRSPSARATARIALIGSLPDSAGLYKRDEDWPE